MPGPPLGPSLRITTTSPALIPPAVTAVHRVLLALEHARRARWCVRSWPGHLHDAALRGEVAAQDHEAAGLLQRIVERPHDLLAGRLLAPRAASSPIVRPVTVRSSSFRSPASSSRLATSADAAGA